VIMTGAAPRGRGRQPADAGCQPDILAQPGDLGVLDREPGEGWSRKAASSPIVTSDRARRSFSRAISSLSGWPGIAGVGPFAGIAELSEPLLELFAQAA